MIGIHENKITRIPLVEAVKQVKQHLPIFLSVNDLFVQTQAVAAAIKIKDFETAVKLRDPDFKELYAGFLTTSALDPKHLLPKEKRLRIAIMQ